MITKMLGTLAFGFKGTVELLSALSDPVHCLLNMLKWFRPKSYKICWGLATPPRQLQRHVQTQACHQTCAQMEWQPLGRSTISAQPVLGFPQAQEEEPVLSATTRGFATHYVVHR